MFEEVNTGYSETEEDYDQEANREAVRARFERAG